MAGRGGPDRCVCGAKQRLARGWSGSGLGGAAGARGRAWLCGRGRAATSAVVAARVGSGGAGRGQAERCRRAGLPAAQVGAHLGGGGGADLVLQEEKFQAREKA
ncbi:unnamed protein product [Urochloa humidicola]